MQLTVKNF